MRDFYKCKYFKIQELVDKKTFERFGESAFMFFDPRLLRTIDAIREYFNKPVLINNWSQGGDFDSRGLRRPDDPEGAKFSQHRFGRAVDFTVFGLTAEEVREIIINNQTHEAFREIKRIEDGVSWVHIDFANVEGENIILFKP